MKSHLAKLVALCVVGLLAGSGIAQEKAREGRKKRAGGAEKARKRREGGGDRAGRGKQRQEQLLKELKLTDKQDAPVRQIIETFSKDMANWQRETGAAVRELQRKAAGARRGRPGGREGKKPEGGEKPKAKPKVDPEEAKAARKKLAELMKQRQEKADNALKQLDEHLTDEQMAVARKYLARGGRAQQAGGQLAALKQLDLDKDQQAKVREILQGARKGGEGAERAERGKAMREAWKKIVDEVLTDAQREKLKELRKKSGGAKRERGQKPRGEGRKRGGEGRGKRGGREG